MKNEKKNAQIKKGREKKNYQQFCQLFCLSNVRVSQKTDRLNNGPQELQRP